MYHHIFKVSYIQAMMIKVNLWVLELILECLLDGSVGSTKENVIQTHRGRPNYLTVDKARTINKNQKEWKSVMHRSQWHLKQRK